MRHGHGPAPGGIHDAAPLPGDGAAAGDVDGPAHVDLHGAAPVEPRGLAPRQARPAEALNIGAPAPRGAQGL